MNEATTRRLAFAKYLYNIGVQQSTAPELMAAASVLTFHDATEFYLQIASEYLNAGGSQPAFLEYWEILARKLPSELAQKEGMRRLNKARVALKHSGTLPSRLDVEAFRVTATEFFQENTPLIFDIEFDTISLLAFVSPAEARVRLEEAETHYGAGTFVEAIDKAAVAFEVILDDYLSRKRSPGRSAFQFGESLTFSGFDLSGLRREDERAARLIEKLVRSIESMRQALRVIGVGVDYRRYSRYRLFAPAIARTMDGKYHVQRMGWAGDPDIGKAEARYCLDFVVDAAIRILDFDYDVPDPWGRRAPAA